MRVSQASFIRAVCNPELPVPIGVSGRPRPGTKRFAVYRNNVIVSLTEALERGYPVVRKLVGDEFFRAMAGDFVRMYPPKSPMMMYFAPEFPAYLEGFKPVEKLPYLPDVARLEIAIRESYHAADSTPAGLEKMNSIPPERFLDARIQLAPSMRLLRSNFPIFSIWQANTSEAGVKIMAMAEDVAVTRKLYDPIAKSLKAGEYQFLTALSSGKTLGAALRLSLSVVRLFDLDETVSWLVNESQVVDIRIESGCQGA